MGPIRVTPHNGPWPLFGRAASQALEAEALRHHAPGELMQRAGLAAARLAIARWPGARRVLVLAGPGNNGGDGWQVAQRLHAQGLQVQVAGVSSASSGRAQPADAATARAAAQPADAATARAAARQAGVPVLAADAEVPAALRDADLVIDALLGLGSSGAPRGHVALAMRWLRAERQHRPTLPVLALDGPCGLDLDTGQPWAADEPPAAATATLALLTLKPGLFTALGRDLCGEIWLASLGVQTEPAGASAILCGPPDGRLSSASHAWHKGSRGDVWVVGGERGMEGAALLAADAAARGGAGRVLLRLLADGDNAEAAGTASSAGALPVRPPHLLALPPATLDQRQALSAATVVAGCGGGAAIAAALPALLQHAGRLVLDADALNAVAQDGSLRQALRERAERGPSTVLTPHPLEAARLLGGGSTAASVQADRLAAAKHLAQTLGACVVLKGSGSIVAAPGCTPLLNPSGNAALATAGSGDVLAGWIGAMWSQQPGRAPHEVTAEAVWRHGDAADRWHAAGHRGVLPAHELAAWIAAVG